MYLFISKVITNGQELIVNQSSGELFHYTCDLRLKFVGFFPFKVLLYLYYTYLRLLG